MSPISDLDADLARRDYTVDALAAEVLEDGSLGRVIDRHGGLDDLEARRLRMVNAANLADDPLRLLRAVRLATELGFEIEGRTAETIRGLAPRLAEVAGERQRDELARILAAPRASEGIRLADALGLLDVLIPELAPARGVEQPSNHHYYDVFEHSLQCVAALDEMLHDIETMTGRPWLGPDLREVMRGFDVYAYLGEMSGGQLRIVLLKLAALLHDVSKPETKAVHEDGRIRFLGHPEQGAVKARAICNRLRFGNRETRFVTSLVEDHLRPTQLAPAGSLPSRRALYRFFRDLGEAAPACLILSLADGAAAAGPRLQRERWRGHVAYARYVLFEGADLEAPGKAAKARLVNGADLMQELGLEAGPGLGRILAALDEAQAVGEITTRDEALAMARQTPPPAPSPPAERGRTDRLAGGETGESEGRGAAPHEHEGRQWRTPLRLWEQLRPMAREMRHEPTMAEDRLWQALRRNQIGVPFRRQYAAGRFILDFYCAKAGLAVEVDGEIHEQSKDQDRVRDEYLESTGIQVLRFRNEEILADLEAVLTTIRTAVAQRRRTTPSPSTGRGQGEGS